MQKLLLSKRNPSTTLSPTEDYFQLVFETKLDVKSFRRNISLLFSKYLLAKFSSLLAFPARLWNTIKNTLVPINQKTEIKCVSCYAAFDNLGNQESPCNHIYYSRPSYFCSSTGYVLVTKFWKSSILAAKELRSYGNPHSLNQLMTVGSVEVLHSLGVHRRRGSSSHCAMLYRKCVTRERHGLNYLMLQKKESRIE